MRGLVAIACAALVLAAGGGVDARLRCPAVRGEPLPYDAEVEWLESDGHQWFVVPVAGSAIFSIRCSFALTQKTSATGSSTVYLFGNGSQWYRGMSVNHDGNYSSLGLRALCNTDDASGNLLINSDVPVVVGLFYDVMLTRQQFSVNSTTVSTAGKSGTAYGDMAMYILSVPFTSGVARPLAKIKFFSMHDSSNTALCDLIPVRKGGVGYLYDRVTKQLFGNAGTGAIIIGPDKN